MLGASLTGVFAGAGTVVPGDGGAEVAGVRTTGVILRRSVLKCCCFFAMLSNDPSAMARFLRLQLSHVSLQSL